MQLPSSRLLFSLAFLGCAGIIAIALYLEHVVGLVPCPLCYVQRVAVILFGAVCLLAALHNPARLGQRIYATLSVIAVGLGIAAAGRQIWLQGLPEDELPACLPSLDYMLEAFPIQDVISKMLHGTADCAEVTWTLLGLNLAEFSLIGFIMMLVFSLFVMLRKTTR